jgi:hypothetical protein
MNQLLFDTIRADDTSKDQYKLGYFSPILMKPQQLEVEPDMKFIVLILIPSVVAAMVNTRM